MGPWRRGSASRSQREGRGSESRRLHQTVPPVARLTRHPCGQTLIMHWKKRWEGPSGPDGPVVAQPPRKRQVAGSNPARGSREASATPGRPEDRAARRAASWTPPFASVVQWQARRSPKPSIRVRVPAGVRRRHPPFWPIGASAPGKDGDGFGMWRSWQRARLGAARPRVRVPPFRRTHSTSEWKSHQRSIAQWIERPPPKREAAGSNPVGTTQGTRRVQTIRVCAMDSWTVAMARDDTLR